jgi:hypothetical protein
VRSPLAERRRLNRGATAPSDPVCAVVLGAKPCEADPVDIDRARFLALVGMITQAGCYVVEREPPAAPAGQPQPAPYTEGYAAPPPAYGAPPPAYGTPAPTYRPAAPPPAYGTPYREGGYAPPAREGGYAPPYREGGYAPPYREGGYAPPYREGTRPPYREGGYAPPTREGTAPPYREGVAPPYRESGGRL